MHTKKYKDLEVGLLGCHVSSKLLLTGFQRQRSTHHILLNIGEISPLLITVNRSRAYITSQAQVKLFCSVIKSPHGHLQDPHAWTKAKCLFARASLMQLTDSWNWQTPFPKYDRNCEFTAHGFIRLYQRAQTIKSIRPFRRNTWKKLQHGNTYMTELLDIFIS
jgi:hypothetical protein